MSALPVPTWPRRVHLLVALAAAAALALGPARADARTAPEATATAPVLTLTPQWAPRLPQAVGYIGVAVDSTGATNVVVTPEPGPGLSVVQDDDPDAADSRGAHASRAGADGPGFVYFHVEASTPGFHTLTIRATADNAPTATVVFPRIWASGGPPLSGHASLAGHLYAYQGFTTETTPDNATYVVPETAFVNFFDKRHVTYQPALRGRIVCPDRDHASQLNECDRYEHDAATGLTQVGPYSIGLFDHTTAYLDQGGFKRHVYQRLVYPRPGHRLAGDWTYRAGGTVGHEHLTLTRSGHYTVRYGVYRSSYHSRGTYRIRSAGRLVLHHGHGRHAKTTVMTLALGATQGGRAAPARYGAYLDVPLTATYGGGYEGNLMKPTGHDRRG